MVKSSGSCLGFGQRVAGDAAAEGGLVLVRYVDWKERISVVLSMLVVSTSA
jgi:hypothetical protein